MMKYTDVYWERKKAACSIPMERAFLEEQILKSKAGYRCKGRCVHYDLELKFGPWLGEGSKFDCDFIETQCWPQYMSLFSLPLPAQGSILSQVVEKPILPPIPPLKRYNIYVILLDSMSFHQSRRNLPKTLYYLDRELKAVEFHHLNKVAKNSYPNAVALWYGKVAEEIEKRMLDGENSTAAGWEDVCNQTMHIMDEAKEYGYKTMLSEYWFYHTLRGGIYQRSARCDPYTAKHRADHEAPPLVNASLFGLASWTSECIQTRKTFSQELQYYGQFIRSYKGTPKFAWFWITHGSHGYQQESMILDTELYEFLIQNKKELDNSFVFFMGDHGLRHGQHMTTSKGEYENKNPFLAISMPAELRDTPLAKNLRRNSYQLQTHFDTRATMLDIIKYQPKTNYSSRKMDIFQGERGASYLREQAGPRTCHTLPIPFQYCTCEYKMEKIDSSMEKTVAMSVLNSINAKIFDGGHTDHCGRWEWKSADVEDYYPIRESGTFRVLLKVRQQGREEALFRALVYVGPGGRLEIIHVSRVDTVALLGDCVPELSEYCHCSFLPLAKTVISYYFSFVVNFFM